MRIPEKSPDMYILSEKYGQEFSNFFIAYIRGDEEIAKYVSEYNKFRYIHWDDLRRRDLPFQRELFWMLLKTIRNPASVKINIGDELFTFVALEKFQWKLHQIDKESPAPIDSLIGQTPSESSKRQYLANSIMEEAIASSQLEGAATTRQVAKKFLREGKAPADKSERMILNNYVTIEGLKELRDFPLSIELIVRIHQMITWGTMEKSEDEIHFRSSNDVVVQDKVDPEKIYHVPPDFNKIPEMLESLCQFANDGDTFVHPILKAIILHFLIGYIHPFNDGNGRTARALFYWYLLKHGYVLFEYLSISQIFVNAPAKYIKAYLYTETDENDMTYFIDYNIGIINRAMDELKRYIESAKAEEREALVLVEKIPGISFRQAEILKDFIKHPDRFYSISEIAGKYRVSLPTARSDLFGLEEAGKILKIRDGKKWIFYYDKSEID
ncbi:Fic family protein [Methanogenium organophilum]|uniref:Fic family protein n=1 Tax=Methanogenium organophilum TaxID=2199 RepID=A0A9X9T6N3_METOG|nr:Fic family protein [Methanogenium organophilum]WAI00533.1 Fic family protein [Methanogenium organophilum]